MRVLPEGRSLDLTYRLLEGAIDIHVHAGPHLTSSPRRVDPFEAAQEAKAAGMQAIVFLDVFEMTNGTSWLVNKVVPDFQTFGGLILNTVYGGMNPRAVKNRSAIWRLCQIHQFRGALHLFSGVSGRTIHRW